MKRYYSTAEVSRLTGLCRKTLYNYELAGLIKPKRIKVAWLQGKGYRVYTKADLKRLELIKNR